MKILNLQLKNFKLFEETDIDFKPITLITGANSSGKSALLNTIASILQSEEPHVYPFEIIPNGKNCLLGSYKDIVSHRDIGKDVSINLSVQSGKTIYEFSSTYGHNRSNGLITKFAWFKEDGNELILRLNDATSHYEIMVKTELINDKINAIVFSAFQGMFGELLTQAKATNAQMAEFNKKLSGPQIMKNYVDNHTNHWIELRSRTIQGCLREVNSNAIASVNLTKCRTAIQTLRKTVSYIGPIRAYQNRYYVSADFGGILDPLGQNTVGLLHDWKSSSKMKFASVVEAIKELGLAQSIQPLANFGDLIRLNVQPHNKGVKYSVADVGFGISQILPVLVADAAVPKGGTLIVNQPEVHLHPASQAQLGNYFATRSINKNYIIETHSEYLINRLRLLVAQNHIDTKNIVIYYIEPTDTMQPHANIHTITIDDTGKLCNAPKSFFDTYFCDTFALTMSGF